AQKLINTTLPVWFAASIRFPDPSVKNTDGLPGTAAGAAAGTSASRVSTRSRSGLNRPIFMSPRLTQAFVSGLKTRAITNTPNRMDITVEILIFFISNELMREQQR